jgi:hypothetical protein
VLVLTQQSRNSGSSSLSSNNRCITNIAAIAFVYAALFLVLVVFIAPPRPSPQDFGTALFVGLITISNTSAGLVFVSLQFSPQYREMRRISSAPRSSSLFSLALQAAVHCGCSYVVAKVGADNVGKEGCASLALATVWSIALSSYNPCCGMCNFVRRVADHRANKRGIWWSSIG